MVEKIVKYNAYKSIKIYNNYKKPLTNNLLIFVIRPTIEIFFLAPKDLNYYIKNIQPGKLFPGQAETPFFKKYLFSR